VAPVTPTTGNKTSTRPEKYDSPYLKQCNPRFSYDMQQTSVANLPPHLSSVPIRVDLPLDHDRNSCNSKPTQMTLRFTWHDRTPSRMSPHPLASAAKKGPLKTLLRSSDRHSVLTKLQIPKIKNTASVPHPEHSSYRTDWLAREAGSDEKASSTNRNLSRARLWCAVTSAGIDGVPSICQRSRICCVP
jgi:hypothetical protein